VIIRKTSTLLALTLSLALPVTASAQSKAGSGAARPIGSQAAGSKAAAGSTVAPGSNAAFGKRSGAATIGSRAAGSKAVGSAAAPAPIGSRAAGSQAALGSQAAPGSKAVGSSAAPIGSRAAGSRAVTLGSQAAPTGSQIARVGSQAAGSKAAGSRVGGFGLLVPRIEGSLPKLSTAAPGLMFVLSDHSTSMARPLAGQAGITKADAVADVVNGVVFDFIDRMNVGGQIRPRIDVVLDGYGASSGSLLQGSLKGKEIVSISELADNEAGTIDIDDGAGGKLTRPVWVSSTASGNTPMRGAFERVSRTVGGWARRPGGSHLVLGINVTDGEPTDGDPRQAVAGLAAQVAAKGGKLLMTNIHLSEKGAPGQSVIFPDEADAAQLDDAGKLLFEMSSPVPAALAERLGTKPGARMMAYNATIDEFAKVFEAGSSVAAQ
jgi:hypothetical protein